MIETRVAEPMFHVQLFKNKTFAYANLAGLLASVSRGGMQFMLIIWLQGIWLPLHGYSFESTPLWAGIYLVPLTVGFLLSGPVSGYLSDRYGTRTFAVGGLLLVAASFIALVVLPVNFPYWLFALIIAINGIGSGLFSSPNTSRRHGLGTRRPARRRGRHAGHVLQLRFGAVDRHLLLADDRRTRVHAAEDADRRPDRPGRPGRRRAADRQPATGGQPVRRVPRVQPARRNCSAHPAC